MLRSLKDLERYAVSAIDSDIGTVVRVERNNGRQPRVRNTSVRLLRTSGVLGQRRPSASGSASAPPSEPTRVIFTSCSSVGVRVCRCIPSTVVVAAFLFTSAASAELKSAGIAKVDMHLPGGTAGLTIDGKSSELVAKESAGVITVTAKLDCVTENRGHTSCIKTGIAMRERHLWKYLESGKFHDATLTVDRSKLKVPGDHETFEDDATGTLSLHGVRRSLVFHYAAQRTGNDIQVHGQINVSLKDFNIEQPSFGGVHTGMVAEIKVQFTLRDS